MIIKTLHSANRMETFRVPHFQKMGKPVKKKEQHGKTMPEVGEISDKDNSDKISTNEGEDDSREWYAVWPQFGKLLTSHLSFRSGEQLDSAGAQPPPEREAKDVSILVPACGRSKLSGNMYDAGFTNITNLDFSKVIISDMLKRNVRVRPEMKWRVMDVTEMQFANETFDAIVDKGGLDSLMEPTLGSSLGCLYLSEVKRVLKAGGKYVCLTLAERHVLVLLFPMFRYGWKISLYAISQEASSRDLKQQTFMVVAEKDSSSAVYDISSFVEQNFFESNSSQARHLSEALLREKLFRSRYADGNDDVIYTLKDLLLGAVGNISKLVPGRRLNLSLGRPEGFIDNGVLFDAKEDSGPFIYPYAVFLVPQNRAHEWMYSSEEGQWHIVKSLKASRLLMILLDSSSSDLSMDDIQMDLSPFVMQLEPEDCGEGFQTPYLREPDEINKQEIVYKDSSVLTGPIFVDDVIYKDIIDDDYKGCTFRRLIFKTTENLVQSEALLSIKESNRISTYVGKNKKHQASKHKRKGKQRKSDYQSSRSPVSRCEVKVVHNHLVSRYHRGIVLGIRLISSYWKLSTSARGLVNTVVIGLGGGLLPMYMKNYLPYLKIEVVEIDCVVLNVARDYFGFSDEERLKVHIRDGTMFVHEKADENSSCKIDILVVDVDSSDSSSALTSPAASFVYESFLLDVKNSLSEKGLFIINLVSGSPRVRKTVYSRVKKVFNCVLSLSIEEGIDEVLFALKTTDSTIKEDQLSKACREFAKSLEHEKKWIDDEVDLSKSIKLLN